MVSTVSDELTAGSSVARLVVFVPVALYPTTQTNTSDTLDLETQAAYIGSMIRGLGVSAVVIDGNRLSVAATAANEENLDAVEEFVSWVSVLFRSSEDGATFVLGYRAATGNCEADGFYEAVPASMSGESAQTLSSACGAESNVLCRLVNTESVPGVWCCGQRMRV